MTDPDRIACCVPFCRRTAARAKYAEATEIICGKCARRAPREKAYWRAIAKHCERTGGRMTGRQWARYERAWERFKAAAIARAGDAPPPKRKTARLSQLRRPTLPPGLTDSGAIGDE